MKDFDLEKAKAGHPVCTRDGRDTRILAFDLKDDIYPICAAVTTDSHNENIIAFTKDGKFLIDQARHHSDLMMKSTKHEGWINIYKLELDPRLGCGESLLYTSRRIYSSYDDAINDKNAVDYFTTTKINDENYFTTIKIEWEE